jgi:hypothetical protein
MTHGRKERNHGESLQLFRVDISGFQWISICSKQQIWTSEQFKIIYGKSRRAFFNSQFESGKTLLLQWKCINEANKDRNTMVYYIVMPAVVQQQVSSAHSLQDVPENLPTLIELEADFFFRRYSRFNNARVKKFSSKTKVQNRTSE